MTTSFITGILLLSQTHLYFILVARVEEGCFGSVPSHSHLDRIQRGSVELPKLEQMRHTCNITR